ncbi:IS30 family transposase [Tessaracoccus antarcticus]|uniref:IS30 family transposase n=1 Tax=Tessaracoccus antarcticus TaxID=2479848 RepID=UPI003899F71A
MFVAPPRPWHRKQRHTPEADLSAWRIHPGHHLAALISRAAGRQIKPYPLPEGDRKGYAKHRSGLTKQLKEDDLITGGANRSAIGTLVERTSGYTVLVRLPQHHTAAATGGAVTEAMAAVPSRLRRTLTWDQGKEMANHDQITAATGLAMYFCGPHSPWQRGTKENGNGLVSQYFPKSTDLRRHSAPDLAAVQNHLNNRPRKSLSWTSPATQFTVLKSADR